MRVLISGVYGLIGGALAKSLKADGHDVAGLVRRVKNPGDVAWDPENNQLDAGAIEGFDAVVHLAGESIAKGRWTQAKKRRIRDSRIVGTRLLAETLGILSRPPKVFLSASAVGYYGDRGEAVLDEASAPGEGFLADVCVEWEGAAKPAAAKNIRVAHPRFGVVLSKDGGALPAMLLPFKMGVGGKIGKGDQFMSWVSLEDAVAALRKMLADEAITGPVNVVAPEPVTNLVFTKALGRALHRPTVLPLPAFAAKIALGPMAQDLLLASARVLPRRLERAGFSFQHPAVDGALRAALP